VKDKPALDQQELQRTPAQQRMTIDHPAQVIRQATDENRPSEGK